jgi:pyruvate/2-oxoglutarate dehydrogenase complex dihydrolipoamide acyltransferase (E2) component
MLREGLCNMVDVVFAPQVNANDSEVKVAQWAAKSGQAVDIGDLLCEVETTKAAVEVAAEAKGYFFPISDRSATVRVGEPLGWILPNNDAASAAALRRKSLEVASGDGQVVSAKAQRLMTQLGLTTNDFAGFSSIREKDVEARAMALRLGAFAEDARLDGFGPTERDVLVYGTGSQATNVLDVEALSGAFGVAAFIDRAPRSESLAGRPVFHAAHLKRLREQGFKRAHLSLPEPADEARAAAQLTELGFELINVIHPSASVAPSAELRANVFLGALTIVGPEAVLEDRVRVLNGASVAHHSRIGAGSRISDGARIAGNVTVGEECLVGLNATVNLRLILGDRVIVNSGANVYASVPSDTVVRIK